LAIDFFEGIFKKNSAEVLPLGNALHSFTYTRDFAKLAVMAMENNWDEKIIFVPNSEPISYSALINKVYTDLETKPKENKIPMFIFRLVSLFMAPVKSILEMEYEWKNDYVVESKFQKTFLSNFIPTPLEDGVKETIAWFRNFYK
jgi:nucleoside-diphosphate-sugar epimerase